MSQQNPAAPEPDGGDRMMTVELVLDPNATPEDDGIAGSIVIKMSERQLREIQSKRKDAHHGD